MSDEMTVTTLCRMNQFFFGSQCSRPPSVAGEDRARWVPQERCARSTAVHPSSGSVRGPGAWAAHNGLDEIDTWTQAGNSAMLRLNEHLGYITTGDSITVSRALPLTSSGQPRPVRRWPPLATVRAGV